MSIIIDVFFFYFKYVDLILNIFKEKVTLIANVFLKLRTLKYVVR